MKSSGNLKYITDNYSRDDYIKPLEKGYIYISIDFIRLRK